MLDAGRYEATNQAKILSTLEASEATRNLLMDFGHPKIPLGLIVRERNPRVPHEQENRSLPLPETLEKVPAARIFLTAALTALFAFWLWAFFFASGDDFVEFGFELHRPLVAQTTQRGFENLLVYGS